MVNTHDGLTFIINLSCM